MYRLRCHILSQSALNPFLMTALSTAYQCPQTLKPWRDDTTDGLPTHSAEDEAAYKFLHRSPHKHGDLGGYGEDFGFHYPPRVFVDPDDPHITPYLNKDLKAGNIRELRYSHHRRFLHALDIDKLVRHARLLPQPHRLLNDFLLTRIPLTDRDIAVFFRYAARVLKANPTYWMYVEGEMFERLLTTLIPPLDVGIHAHAELIRCAAVVGKWEEGYHWFRPRTVDYKLAENANFYDAVLELCEVCQKPEEGWIEFEKLLKLAVKIPGRTLSRMLNLAAMNGGDLEKGKHVWALYEYFDATRDKEAYSAYLHLLATQQAPEECLAVFAEAEHANVHTDIAMIHCVVYSLSVTPGYMSTCKGLLRDLLQSSRGIMPDYQTFIYIFLCCARNRDSDAAVEMWSLCRQGHDLHPEAVYYLFSALRWNDGTKGDTLLNLAADVLQAVRRKYPRSELHTHILHEYYAVLASLGAFHHAMSALKFFVATESPLGPRVCAALLDAIANGGQLAVDDATRLRNVRTVLTLMLTRRVAPTAEVEAAYLRACPQSLLADPSSDHLWVSVKGLGLGEWGLDPPLPPSPREFRRYTFTFGVTREEIELKKYGQMLPRFHRAH